MGKDKANSNEKGKQINNEKAKNNDKTIKKSSFKRRKKKIEMSNKSNWKRKKINYKNGNSRSIMYKPQEIRPNFRVFPEVGFDKAKAKKYDRGDPVANSMVKVRFEQMKMKEKEKKVEFALQQSVRSELLLTEEEGYLKANEGEETCQFSQSEIQSEVDLISAAKRFDLTLSDFGPYRMNYTRNGRFLLLGGRKGHVAAIDWISKKLKCEINVMESVHDVAWLHQETLYSVAQKKWVYFYDNQGTEIHCVKKLNNVIKLLFLPYHFLLATVGSAGFLNWLDITIGKIIAEIPIAAHRNPATVAQHPGNALVCIGQPSGVVSFWSPNHKKPHIIKWCHRQPLCAISFDPKGHLLATASVDRTLKLWDARNLKGPLQFFTLRSAPNCISLSHKGFMALGLGNVVEIYNDCSSESAVEKKLYLRHSFLSPIKNMEFCPFEDVMGVAHTTGFSSILVPGCAEANFDALEINPFQTKSQRKEAEVQQLLAKIPADLITWDPTDLRKIHIPSLEDIIEQKKKIPYIKPPNVHIEPRYKMGTKKGSAKTEKRKQIMKEELRRNQIKKIKEQKGGDNKKVKKRKTKNKESVLDRFKAKIKN